MIGPIRYDHTSYVNVCWYLHRLKIFIVFDFQTSIVFSLEEGPGVLFKALAVFALRDINLSKVIFKS